MKGVKVLMIKGEKKRKTTKCVWNWEEKPKEQRA